jgi:hypothetical protein
MTRDEIISAMKEGATLHMEHTEDGKQFWLHCTHLPVRTDVGERVIADPIVISAGDALFDDALPQTFRIE